MEFTCSDRVTHPAEVVHSLLRDDMTKILPYLPDVDAIEVLTREDEATGVRIVNLWRASEGAVPRVAQAFLKPEMLTWKDHALWLHEARKAQWRLEPNVGGDLFDCNGSTTVTPDGDGACRIDVAGALNVYPERVKGVPRLLAGKMRSTVESFVVRMIVPNMETMARGVQGYLDDQSQQG
ncbi:MAG: hypothetical protein KDD82_20615 [Planctomycetes bacterium]|nr:hypothetical protein [Planctomycetota bacterium]